MPLWIDFGGCHGCACIWSGWLVGRLGGWLGGWVVGWLIVVDSG